jgi:hypothetical protein
VEEEAGIPFKVGWSTGRRSGRVSCRGIGRGGTGIDGDLDVTMSSNRVGLSSEWSKDIPKKYNLKY